MYHPRWLAREQHSAHPVFRKCERYHRLGRLLALHCRVGRPQSKLAREDLTGAIFATLQTVRADTDEPFRSSSV